MRRKKKDRKVDWREQFAKAHNYAGKLKGQIDTAIWFDDRKEAHRLRREAREQREANKSLN
jgi:hypothetical protein